MLDMLDMLDITDKMDNMDMVDCIDMVNMQKTFGFLTLLVDTSEWLWWTLRAW